MPTIVIDKKDLFRLMGKKISDKVLKEKIPMLGTDLEGISEKEIHVEIFPNRPDMLSEEGFARALASFLGIKPGMPKYTVHKSSYKYTADKKSKENVQPYTIAAVVKGVKFDEASIRAIMNLQEKLHTTHGRNRKRMAMGVYDLSTITFPVLYTAKPRSFKFTALETNKEATVEEILTLHPKGKDFAHLLTKKEVPIWIDANNQVLSMPPVINSEETKITKDTKDVFLEATGTSQEAVEQAVNILLAALRDRGGKIYALGKEPNLDPKVIKVSLDDMNKKLGLNLNKKEAKQLLAKMGMHFDNNKVYYPAYRGDILHPDDIMEDLAIAYGYDNFSEEIPRISTIGEEDELEKFKDNIAEICVGLGIQEVMTYHLTNKETESKKMLLPEESVEIANSISSEYNVLRARILPSLIDTLSRNRHNEYPQILFEIGKVFKQKKSDIDERESLGIVICHSKTDFTEGKKITEGLATTLGIKLSYNQTTRPFFIDGRAAEIKKGNKKVGILGEINPQVIHNVDLDMPIVAIEIDIAELNSVVEK